MRVIKCSIITFFLQKIYYAQFIIVNGATNLSWVHCVA